MHPHFTPLQTDRLKGSIALFGECKVPKLENKVDDVVDQILMATVEYNRSIDSVTGKRPMDIIQATPQETRKEIMEKRLSKHNLKGTTLPGKTGYSR